MKKKLQNIITFTCYYLEMFISFMLILLIAALALKLLMSSAGMLSGTPEEIMNSFIYQAMSLAVGVELIKLLSSHTPETVVEVLLFAITRQIVVNHGQMIETLIGVVAIAVLFGVRKYLFGVSGEKMQK